MSTTTAPAKEDWIKEAEKILGPYLGEQSRQYAEGLYQTYVVDDGDHWTAQDAVDEDLSYWGD